MFVPLPTSLAHVQENDARSADQSMSEFVSSPLFLPSTPPLFRDASTFWRWVSHSLMQTRTFQPSSASLILFLLNPLFGRCTLFNESKWCKPDETSLPESATTKHTRRVQRETWYVIFVWSWCKNFVPFFEKWEFCKNLFSIASLYFPTKVCLSPQFPHGRCIPEWKRPSTILPEDILAYRDRLQ